MRNAVHLILLVPMSFLAGNPRVEGETERGRGRGPAAGEQASRLEARHREGQTILTWKEVEPSLAVEEISAVELRKKKGEMERKVSYRIYRSARPISTLEGLEPIGEAPALSAWNGDFHGTDPRSEDQAFRYAVEDGKGPVPPGTGIFAQNPKETGKAWYAVTAVRDGKEDRTLAGGNVLESPAQEDPGPGPFILQRMERPASFNYIDDPTLHFYVRWESPPNSSAPGRPFDYLVAVPPKSARPAPVGIHLHCWGGSLRDGYGWWYNAEKGAILIATNQIPYDWWTGYHEFLWTSRPLRTEADWKSGVVRPFTQRRLFSFLDWVAGKWEVDLARTFAAGSSMGGSGSPMLAIRYPERIAWAISWVGVHDPARSPQFRSSYENVFGRHSFGVKFEDGTPVWDHYSDSWYLRKHPEKEIGFITFSNGKNDGGIGWPQALDFFRALQATRRPHIFRWGQAGHGQRAEMPAGGGERICPIDIRTDRSLPAFTRSSLDDDPGNGDPADGDPEGQANLFLYWETEGSVDEPDRWEMTVGLIPKAPKEASTADITPRRLQRFKVRPGERLRWTNLSLAGMREVQSGEAAADPLGLVTLEGVEISKGKNRIRIVR